MQSIKPNFLKYLFIPTLLFTVAATLTSCHDEPEYKNTIKGNFDALVDIIDTRYCFLDDKDIDWRYLAHHYRGFITPETTDIDLFFICSALLDELKDGHVNLTSRFDTSYYREWWTDYPQDFNLRTLEEYYLKFNWLTTNGIMYTRLPGEVAYMYYPSFSYTISELSLDYILAILYNSRGLIIDIRDNGGGALTNINTLVGRFIDEEITGGYIMHKTGPGHSDFSEPYPITYKPADEGRIKWNGEVVVLTNRSCFSAANNFASVMKELPNVRIVGAKTGGGGGLPFSSELPIGWSIRFSACPILNSKGEIIENGIEPSEGCEVHSPDEELAEGRDAILEFAIDLLKDNPLPFPDEDEGEEEQPQ
ncbi:MAG: S41 family peptidase [Muribaculaceae bacterium]|nr:S41 family peptidase [Muribaculaceae bacterium]